MSKLSELMVENRQLKERVAVLEQWFGVTLDCVDYRRHACGLTEMVGAALPTDILEKARAALEKK